MNRAICQTGPSLAVAAFACLTGCHSPSAETEHGQTGSTASLPAELTASGVGDVFWTPAYSESVDVDEQGHLLILSGGELNPISSSNETLTPAPYETWGKTFQLAFAPTAASFRTGNELYVAGKLDNGDTVIERWDFPHITGAYYSTRAVVSLPNPFGTSVTTGPLALGIEGGTYVLPALRSAPTATTTTVYSGTALGRISGLEIDPDGRFLLVIDDVGGGRLVQFRLLSPPTIHLIADEAQYPGLANSGSPRPIDQSQVGRLYFLHVGESVLWVEDPTNDAILDQVSLLDYRSFYLAFPELTWTMAYP